MRYLGALLILLVCFACAIDKSEIRYGEEVCDHCHMLIMDNRFGAELVTDKGKAYKFDAMECLINFKRENSEIIENIHSEWTNIYKEQGSLHNAYECYYLRSGQMPSPMGMYINAFNDRGIAEAFKEENGGKIYNWEELNSKFIELPILSH